jgi:hypothetical protein
VLSGAKYALGLGIREAPLVIRVLAHKVDGWQVELGIARSASSDLECFGYRWVGQRGEFCRLGGGLCAVRLYKGPILDVSGNGRGDSQIQYLAWSLPPCLSTTP